MSDVDPKILMEMNERLRFNKINTYYQRELARLDVGSDYCTTVKFTDSTGESTKHLSLNLESIPDIIDWMQSLQKILKIRASENQHIKNGVVE